MASKRTFTSPDGQHTVTTSDPAEATRLRFGLGWTEQKPKSSSGGSSKKASE